MLVGNNGGNVGLFYLVRACLSARADLVSHLRVSAGLRSQPVVLKGKSVRRLLVCSAAGQRGPLW